MLRRIKGEAREQGMVRERSCGSFVCGRHYWLEPMWVALFNYHLLERWSIIAKADARALNVRGASLTFITFSWCLTWGCSKAKATASGSPEEEKDAIYFVVVFQKALFSNHPLNSQPDGLILAHGTIPQRLSNDSIWLRWAGLMLVQEVTIKDLQTSSPYFAGSFAFERAASWKQRSSTEAV